MPRKKSVTTLTRCRESEIGAGDCRISSFTAPARTSAPISHMRKRARLTTKGDITVADVFHKKIVVKNQTYVFRFPTGRDMIRIDLRSRQMRDGITEGLALSVQMSQAIATLEQLCEEPKNVDFGAMHFNVLNKISQEVTEWINTFLDEVGDDSGVSGRGDGE